MTAGAGSPLNIIPRDKFLRGRKRRHGGTHDDWYGSAVSGSSHHPCRCAWVSTLCRKRVDAVLEQSQKPSTRFFGLQILEDTVKTGCVLQPPRQVRLGG